MLLIGQNCPEAVKGFVVGSGFPALPVKHVLTLPKVPNTSKYAWLTILSAKVSFVSKLNFVSDF